MNPIEEATDEELSAYLHAMLAELDRMDRRVERQQEKLDELKDQALAARNRVEAALERARGLR